MSATSTLPTISAGPLFVDGPTIDASMSTTQAVNALEAVLLSGFNPEEDSPRSRVDTTSGLLMQMPSTLGDYVGSKLLTITPGNTHVGSPVIQGLYVLFGGGDQRPLAVMDGTTLTGMRTSAVSAFGALQLATPGPKRLVVFGTGVQAWEHIRAFTDVFEVTSVEIIGRSGERAEALAERARSRGIDARTAGVDAVRHADLIVCCTSAAEPLFDGRLVADSAVVVAMGSHVPGERELDDALMERATVCVESLDSALREAGDVVMALTSGAIAAPTELVTVADLVQGRARIDHSRPAVFKTTGMPWEDLAVATAVYTALTTDAPANAISPVSA
ncbi:ornithine cyclodeaminase family protein [Cryobacterium sp. MLB-32]|uniref:ornithine cyclodeaminase family protein n=1 Tax=Cryobacterium sp. MLB-32 TaxID=1529318 RepID=UPI0006922EAE|nr:ornithine cyclodeaminase family protein [Cryobacterium sp. MLB-32]